MCYSKIEKKYSHTGDFMNIYIVLSHTGSMPSKLIRRATQSNYTHVSISLDPSLSNMYSFGRKYLHLPYPAGFIREDISSGLFRVKKSTIISVYKIQVSKESFKMLDRIINKFTQMNNMYFYDLKGALGVYLKRDMFRENGYVCSSFVNKVLNDIGVSTDKKDWEIKPQEFSQIQDFELIYEGVASRYMELSKQKNQAYAY